MSEPTATPQRSFFSYKGYPLVRKGNEIYYGNMSDDYVVWMQILSTSTISGIEVANKIRLFKIATDDTVPAAQKIVNTTEKNGLYEALDIANAWLGHQAV
ncbi:MAG: hypothetical protein QM689_00685 [Oscillospiraceae bacterium]